MSTPLVGTRATPSWVAGCYGVTVNDECPEVDITPEYSEDPQAHDAWLAATRQRDVRAAAARLTSTSSVTTEPVRRLRTVEQR